MNGPLVARAALKGCAAFVFIVLALTVQRGEAHKAVTSKYTYNDDVFPILRAKCAACHVEHGVAPMSLVTYKDAYPWAESIRAELIAGHMPPWNAEDAFGRHKNPRTLTAKELDVILTWATGGNPQGDLNQQLPAVTLKNDWTLGAPDLALRLPAEFTVPADALEVTQEFTLPTGTKEARWVRAVDLLPGNPSIVRSAVVYRKDAPDRVLALWLPGHDLQPLERAAAFHLPAAADLVVRIHYKKPWQFEGQALADRSAVGVYFSNEKDAQDLASVALTSPPLADVKGPTVSFAKTLDDDLQALAIRPDDVPPNITVQVQAVLPDGSRAPMIRLNTRADWARRYWFEKPLALPRGTKIEVVAVLENPDLLSEAFDSLGTSKPPAVRAAIRMSLDVVSTHARPSAP